MKISNPKPEIGFAELLVLLEIGYRKGKIAEKLSCRLKLEQGLEKLAAGQL